jgi:hypothetical protein
MGKSFWAHALADPDARDQAAKTFLELAATDVRIGFNASERLDPIAPTPNALQEALRKCDAESVWRAVLLRAAASGAGEVADVPTSTNFSELAAWVQANNEKVDEVLTRFDNHLAGRSRRLLIVFDALDRLANDWVTTQQLTVALLKRALAVRSYRTLRVKLFMRRDQFEDPTLFAFPDGSKIRNTRVDLNWSSTDLYTLLFVRLAQVGASAHAFNTLTSAIATQMNLGLGGSERHKLLVDAIAGEFMGSDKKRGRVFTWLPLHLSDARGETSPRTFLTAWREGAHHPPAPPSRAIDHLGLLEGVRKASEDRLQELQEDYWWIASALAPLRGQMVPIDSAFLQELWRTNDTAESILAESNRRGNLPPVQLIDSKSPEASLVDALSAIGVVEIRSNGKINVPDIFRVEAGIKRKGGVKLPQHARGDRD